MNYPLYFRKDGRCVRRLTDTTGTEVIVPATPKQTLPLCLSEVTYPTKQRFDEEVATMELVDQECFEAYVHGFIGRVEQVNRAMIEVSIKRQLANTKLIKI